MTSGGFAPLDSTEGCRNQSERAASRNRKASQATLDKGLSNLQRKIETDPKVRSIALTWKKCMAENGYRYDSRFQVINFLNEQAQMVMIGENKPGAIPPGIAQLEKLESQISATDAACVSVGVIPQGCVGVFPQWFLAFCSS
jgi:hypothetical protein